MSIHRRLLVGLLLGLMALFSLSGGLLYFCMRIVLLRQFDTALTANARALGGLIKQQADGQLEFEFSPESMPEFGPNALSFFIIRRSDGSVLARSQSLGHSELRQASSDLAGPISANVVLPSGRPGRSIALQVVPASEEDEDEEGNGPPQTAENAAEKVHLVVAQDRGDVDRTLGLLLSTILLVAVLMGIGTALVVTATVRRGLRPLDRVASEAASIDEKSLAFRFSLDQLPSELVPICLRLNESLERLEAAFQRERRFTGDVAHELRTPIAELRSLADVALRWPDDSEASTDYFQDVQEIAKQMEAMVSALLSLTRCHSGNLALSPERLPLSDAIRQVWRRHEKQAADKALAVVFDVPAWVEVDADRAILSAILGNLLANAVEYTPCGGTVAFRAEQSPSAMRLTVTNDCDGPTPEDLPYFCEPFWRKDPARTDGSHCGLGLTLADAYCKSMGWDIRLQVSGHCCLTVAVTVPMCPVRPDGVPSPPSLGVETN